MKKPLVFLALSLAANAALLVTYFVRPTPAHSVRSDDGAASAQPAAPGATGKTGGEGALSPADTAALRRSGELLANSDLPKLVAQLRAAGFSRALIRALISAQVNEQFRARRVALLAQTVPSYWSAESWLGNNRQASAELAALGREQTAMLKKLLGTDAVQDEEWSRLNRERVFGGLPQEKIDRLQAITNDYNDLRSQISQEARGIMLPEDQAKMALIAKEQRADIEKLLTPAELEEYDLRNSNTANRLRFQLSAFSPTEEEFRTLYRLTQAAEAQSGARADGTQIGPISAEDRARQQAAKAALQAQIDAALGPARAAEYRQAIEPAYQEVARLLNRLDLPVTIAPQVISVQQDIQQRANAVRQDRSLTAEDRTSQLEVLAQEAQARLTSSLGQRGYEAYKNYGGWWVNNLVPRPRANPAGPVIVPAVQFGVPPKT